MCTSGMELSTDESLVSWYEFYVELYLRAKQHGKGDDWLFVIERIEKIAADRGLFLPPRERV